MIFPIQSNNSALYYQKQIFQTFPGYILIHAFCSDENVQ